MQYGICDLNCVAVRQTNSDTSEMVTQLLFGDSFQVLEKQKKWSRIRIAFDFYEGWIDNKQYALVSEETYTTYKNTPDKYLIDIAGFAINKIQSLTFLSIGANLKAAPLLALTCDGEVTT